MLENAPKSTQFVIRIFRIRGFSESGSGADFRLPMGKSSYWCWLVFNVLYLINCGFSSGLLPAAEVLSKTGLPMTRQVANK